MISIARNALYVCCCRVGTMHYGIVAAVAIVYTSLTSNYILGTAGGPI